MASSKSAYFGEGQKVLQWLPSWATNNVDWVAGCYALFMKQKMTLEKT